MKLIEYIKRLIAPLLCVLLLVSAVSCSLLESGMRLLEKGVRLPESGSVDGVQNSDTESGPDLSAAGEERAESERRRFDEFLQRDFIEIVTSDALSLRFTIKNPESYGIADYEVNWGELGVYPSDEMLQKERAALREFGTFARGDLTREQRESYDIYAYYAELYDTVLETYLLYDPLTGANGFHATIPMVMSEYQFFSRADIEEYLLLLEQFGVMLDSHIEYQRERSRHGLFMSDSAADEVIDACAKLLAKRQGNIFLESFEKKMDAISGLGDSVKADFAARNRELFDSVVVPAYERLTKEMRALKGTGRNSGGLANFELGKDYYRCELRLMGIDRSPEQLIEDCDSLLQEYFDTFYSALYSNQWLIDNYESRLTIDRTAAEIVDYLRLRSKEDFPTLDDSVDYSLNVIDESVRGVLSAGFYFMPQLDGYTRNSIYYNPDYFRKDPDYMFFLFAHEGYPGHLLQRVSVLVGSLPDWRKIVQFRAYTEGWAQYVQYVSYRYADSDPLLSEVRRLEDELDSLLAMRVDLGIHYEGWTAADMKAYVSRHLPYEMPDAAVRGFYAFIVKNPLQMIPYYGGVMEIRALYARYSELLGDDFDERVFHEELLKYGVAPFSLLGEWMDESLLGHRVA